jgi:hypothetical protein
MLPTPLVKPVARFFSRADATTQEFCRMIFKKQLCHVTQGVLHIKSYSQTARLENPLLKFSRAAQIVSFTRTLFSLRLKWAMLGKPLFKC